MIEILNADAIRTMARETELKMTADLLEQIMKIATATPPGYQLRLENRNLSKTEDEELTKLGFRINTHGAKNDTTVIHWNIPVRA